MEALHQTILEHAYDRRPYCFRAHVPGQGYVNDGTRADLEGAYLEQYRKALRTEVECMTWAPDYADRRGRLLCGRGPRRSRPRDVSQFAGLTGAHQS